MYIFSPFNINIKYAYLAPPLHLQHFALTRAVEVAVDFVVLEEVALGELLLEVGALHEVVVHAVFFAWAGGTCGARDAELEIILVVFHEILSKRRLTSPRGPNQDQRLSLQLRG